MPPKGRSVVVNIKPEDLSLQCEWKDCTDVFNSMDTFTPHVTGHLMEHINFTSQEGPVTELVDKHCHWQECNVEIDGDIADYLRHVYYHTFHVKIKCIGALLLEKTGRNPCLYHAGNRNLIPDLPECLECGWDMCHARFENAEMFYQHVQSHADYYPEGNLVKAGCRCFWEGCEVTVKSKHKLKDHFKSHTQEKKVACPTCGALFSCRTKFFDHLSRQPGYNTGNQYQCSHCNTVFGDERLLREHMRYHVNQFKCPFCDMSTPSPSNMRLHIRYRHSDEKPHKCDKCDYRCKSMHDLKKHMDRHNEDNLLFCDVPDCKFKTKTYRSLENHFSRLHHRVDTSLYQCHVCESSFSRGAMLTKHLKTKHKFNWPSGHSRFRYKRHIDGKWRLQTVRYESVEMTTQLEAPSSQNATASNSNPGFSSSQSSDQLLDMPSMSDQSPSGSSGIILVEKLNTPTASEPSGSENSVCLVSVIDSLGEKKAQHVVKTEGQSSETSPEIEMDVDFADEAEPDVTNSKLSVDHENEAELAYNITVEAEGNTNVESENAIEIRIVENEKGEYIMQRNDSGLDQLTSVEMNTSVNDNMIKNMDFQQETMYNLQMLGDVALKEKNQDSEGFVS